MSTEGSATVVLVPAGMVLLPTMVVVGAVAGTGYLIVRGVMLCGKKLDEHYQAACKTWSDEQMRNYLLDRQKRADPRALVAAALDELAAARANVREVAATPDVAAAERMDAELARALAGARNAAHSVVSVEPSGTPPNIRAIQARLHVELEESERLPASASDAVRAARAALAAPEPDAHALEGALERLRAAWMAATETTAIRAHDRGIASASLTRSSAQIEAIRGLVRHERLRVDETVLRRLSQADSDIAVSRGRLETNPSQARREAEALAATVSELTATVSQAAVDVWDRVRARLMAVRGRLRGLANVLADARQSGVVAASALAPLEESVRELEREGDDLLNAESAEVAAAERALAAFAGRVEATKLRVFTVLARTQQMAIGETVAGALLEAGFTSARGSTLAPELVQQADGSLTITGVRDNAPSGHRADERLVSFTVGGDGHVHYDFAGYAGASCLDDARRILARLREQGIVLLDPEQDEHLDVARVSEEALRALPLPSLDVNKLQTERRERVRAAFARLGYHDVQESTYGGTIQFDGRNGPLGYYHVALGANGAMEVFNNRVDVSNDATDRLIQGVEAAAPPTLIPVTPQLQSEAAGSPEGWPARRIGNSE